MGYFPFFGKHADRNKYVNYVIHEGNGPDPHQSSDIAHQLMSMEFANGENPKMPQHAPTI